MRYVAYEMGLEQLRKKRMERLSEHPRYSSGTTLTCAEIGRMPGSVSEYALLRRQFQIFERALKKFKEDVSMWVDYIELARREGARSLVGRITAR